MKDAISRKNCSYFHYLWFRHYFFNVILNFNNDSVIEFLMYFILELQFMFQTCVKHVLKDTPKAFDDFKNKQKSVWSNAFWYVKVCIFWKCIQYTIHWDKTQMLKKFPSDKINGTKNALFFLSRAPTHHSFTFNLRFLYELKHKVHLSKTVCGIFHFQFRFVFIKVYIFVQQNAWILWL